MCQTRGKTREYRESWNKMVCFPATVYIWLNVTTSLIAGMSVSKNRIVNLESRTRDELTREAAGW